MSDAPESAATGSGPRASRSRVPVDAEVRVHDARADVPDEDLDRSLRPPTLADFVNQEQVTEQLAIFIEAARGRGEPLDHVLLAGPPGPRQDLAGPHRRRRDGGADGADGGTGAGAQGRRRLLPHRAGARQRLLHRRDPPPRPRGRGDALPGDGGRRAAGRARPGRRRAHGDAAAAAVHAGRRDDPRRPADDAAARPLRRLASARALQPRAPGADRRALGGDPRGRDRRRGRRDDRRPLARHAAGRQPPAEAGPRLRPGQGTAARSTPRSRRRRWRCSRSTPRASTAATAPCSTPSRPSSAAARSASRRWRSRSARSRTRSRTCSSPTCSSRAC